MSDLFHGAAPVGTSEPRSRSARRNNPGQRRRRRQRRIRSILIVLLTAALVVGAGFLVKDFVGSFFDSGEQEITDYPGPGTGEVEVEIKQGASGAAIGQALVDNGVIATQAAFTDALKSYTTTYGADPNLQYGTYKLQLEMPAADALLAMLDSANRIQNGVTIREGLRTDETIERLVSVTSISVEDFEEALKDTDALGLPEAADGNVEGWFAPATYPYTDDTTAEDLLSRMIAKQVSDLDGLGVAAKDRQEVLIKASIVESEAPADARAKVAQVIENRLAIDMSLEMDSTVHYYDGRSENATTSAEARRSDNPYNTYRFPGLPPGPISNPGKAAIEATLSPEPGDWLFFVTVNTNTGETKFAKTYPEHQLNQAEWQQFLRDEAERRKKAESEGSE